MYEVVTKCSALDVEMPFEIRRLAALHDLIGEIVVKRDDLVQLGKDTTVHDFVISRLAEEISAVSSQRFFA